MCNIRLQAPTLARKCEISHWLPCGADGQVFGRMVRRTFGHVTTNISFIDRSPNFLSYGAALARAWSSVITCSCANQVIKP